MSNNKKRKKHQQKIRKRINKKKLVRRTNKKIKDRKKRKVKQQRKKIIKKRENYNSKNNELIYCPPPKFSIIDNSNKTIEYFNDIINILNNENYQNIKIFFDIENVDYITIDAIMYLLAVVKNTKIKHNSRGTIPKKEEIAKIFKESGFLNYVNSNSAIPFPKSPDKIQIKMSNDSNDIRNVAKEVISFLINKFEIEKKEVKFLYNMIYELLLNTNEHAYNSSDLLSYWYLYLEVDGNIVKVSLLDTGDGIPNTINKKNIEKAIVLNKLFSDGELIISAFENDKKTIRSETKEKHRGKGLPTVSKNVKLGKVENFTVISGKAKVYYLDKEKKYKYDTLDTKFTGTLYYWEIDILKLKER